MHAAKTPTEQRILTALPVYNEAQHVNDVLDSVRKYSDHTLVVDDGSTDKTPWLLKLREQQYSDLRVIRHHKNRGYGAALRTAFEYAIAQNFDILVTIDCDGQHQPELIPVLAAATHRADIVSGSRYLEASPAASTAPEDRRRINREITTLLNELLGLELTDSFCGFKAYRVPKLKSLHLTQDGYAMPLEMWVQSVFAGLSIIEYPVPLVYLDEERSFGGNLDDARRRRAHYLEVIQAALRDTPWLSERMPRIVQAGELSLSGRELWTGS